MRVRAKICGVNSAESAVAAAKGGAAFIGFVFYPPSPRFVTGEEARGLASLVPAEVERVGVFVDATDEEIAGALDAVPLSLLQFHGSESPDRVYRAKTAFSRPVMKAIRVRGREDLTLAGRYLPVADWLLFDAKPPAAAEEALPGGNALVFDWRLLAGGRWPLPWMLSGGLDAENVARAVRLTGARVVDVSSGVEDRHGHKDPARISSFLETVAGL